MEKEPLLPYLDTRLSNPSPPPLPGTSEITPPALPSELKDRLNFGLPAADESASVGNSLVDALFDSQNPQSSWGSDPNHCFKTNLHRSKTAPAMVVIHDLYHARDPKPPQFGASSIVWQVFALLIIYISLGVTICWFNRHNFRAKERHPLVDALYFCILTLCTVGYGDLIPDSAVTKIFSIMFALVGFGLLSGMVSYVLDLQESCLLKSLREGERQNVVKKGWIGIQMKVGLALWVVVLCIGIGVCVMHFVEELGWLDSFYHCVMSVTTVGCGDRAFTSMAGRLFTSVLLLVSTLAVARAFLYWAEARADKRHRTMAKWVLGQDMTVDQFLAADIDNKGFVSKSEYVIYKLKEMGKVSEEDIMQISKIFERLYAGNFGKITLADIMENHH